MSRKEQTNLRSSNHRNRQKLKGVSCHGSQKRTCFREETVIKTAGRTSKLTTGFGNMNVISDLNKSGSLETWEDIGGSEY